MSRLDRTTLREAMLKAGEEKVLQFFGDKADQELDRLLAQLKQFIDEFETRYGDRPDPIGLLSENPVKAAAFFQLDTLELSTQAKMAVWWMLSGADLMRLNAEVVSREYTRIALRLKTPVGEQEFVCQDPSDFRLLRHLGTVRVDGKLAIDGYYALRRS